MQIIIAYIPVIHEGYRRFFEKYPNAETLYILGKEFVPDYKPLAKDIRALPPELVKQSLEGWKRFKTIAVVDKAGLVKLAKEKNEIVMPDEEVCRDLAEKYFGGAKKTFDTIFLRWDKYKAQAELPVAIDQKISFEKFDRDVITRIAKKAEERSSDFWRRIGSAIVKNGKIVLEVYNEHQPTEHAPYAAGDPRSSFSQGIHVELSSSFHSESRIIAEAARKGIKLEGCDMYASTFPCPPCAKSVAFSGIKRFFYSGGYAVLDGADILKSKGIEIIFVDFGK